MNKMFQPEVNNIEDLNADWVVTTLSQHIRRDLRKHPLLGLPPCARNYVIQNQSDTFLKKYLFENADHKTLERKTFDKFLEMNEHIGQKGLFSFPVAPRVLASYDDMTKCLLRARSFCHQVLARLDMEEFFLECKNSGGVSIGVPFSDTSINKKLSYPISITRNAQPYFDRYLQFDHRLNWAIETFNSTRPETDKYSFEGASRATTVPKTNKINRMIAIEPTGNMFLQQGLMGIMYKRLAEFGFDVSVLPDVHKSLADLSSTSGFHATIDFSSASDCISIGLVEFLFPPDWFKVLNAVRVSHMDLKDSIVKLNMFSTMGNATTFPIETLIFLALSVATDHTKNFDDLSLFHSGHTKCCPNGILERSSVFGDDCIIPTSCVPLFKKVTSMLGMIINSEKSYWSGNFRESCGGDYLHGSDVRAFNIKRPTTSRRSGFEPWLYIVTNALLTKYKSYFGELTYLYDKQCFKLLFSLFEKYNILVKVVPDDYPDDSGLKISSDIDRIRLCYPISFNRITRDEHGTLRFNYMRFQYKESYKVDSGLLFYTVLKNMHKKQAFGSNRPIWDRANLRRIGGYVVAKGLNCHWQFEPVP